MTLLEIIQQKYPDAQPGDFEVIQDGTELQLVSWNVRNDGAFTKRPSEEELRTWIDQVEQQQLQNAAREANLKRMVASINKGCVGVHLAQLETEHEHRLLKALLIMHGAFGPDGRVRPVSEWHNYQQEEVI